MWGPPGRQALWALAVLGTLAPSLADGNIGCLFSAPLCIQGIEWCYDDDAFGKCIPIYEDEPEEGALYKYDMSDGQLQQFERQLQRLSARGYGWQHAYTQCVLQAMLYSMRNHLDVTQVNTKICDHFVDPKLMTDDAANPTDDVEPDESAYIRFSPNSETEFDDSENPADPLSVINDDQPPDDESNKIRDLILMRDEVESPAIMPFGGFRERLQSEGKTNILEAARDRQKKGNPAMDMGNDDGLAGIFDEERLIEHARRLPNMADDNMDYGMTQLDPEVLANAMKKYRQSFAAKNFPFEYENPRDNEIPDPKIYTDEDILENYPIDGVGSELDPTYIKDPSVPHTEQNMEYLKNYWKIVESNLRPPGAIYSEGGPLKADDDPGDNIDNKQQDLQGLLYNEWGFKRRERDDVKKPGPRIDANVLKFLYNKNVTAQLTKGLKKSGENQYDPSYAYVKFKNRFGTNWDKGVQFINKLEELLGLEKNTFTNPRVDPEEVTFKVEKNSKGLDAAEVARRVDAIKDELRLQTGAQVYSTGVGDRSKRPVVHYGGYSGSQVFGLELPVFLALVGSLSVLIVGGGVFIMLVRRDMDARKKMQGLASAADIDAEATRDYQELCRARMSGKWSGPQPAAEPPQRITSLSKEPVDGNSPSTRSSTSSWSEEPALTNMDISTGHMVLAYMEDHLRNKDRLEQEWRALCAYEAEPCATTAALRPENTGKNRYTDVLPYDHSRVVLNTLTNHLESDYINASTITDHDPRNPAYIAAAGPLAHTAPDFWQLVWEQGSVVMVMLTRLTENGQQLCHRYWPETTSELYHIYEVHLVSEHIWCDDYLVRSFYLKNQRTGETRTVTQFHFLSWPENGVPSSTKALLEFRRKVNKSYRGRSCPIVVHCSDGAGRTGTYCLIDMVLNRMSKGAKEIDIAATLEHIRDQRPRTVATKHQFEFVLMAVAEEVHAILKALPAHLQQLQEKKDKEKEKEKDGSEKDK